MAAAPDGMGYWLVASDGGIFSFGMPTSTAPTGSQHLNRPIVGMALAPGPVASRSSGVAADISPGGALYQLSNVHLATTLEEIVASGATWLRVDVPWTTVESAQGSFDWNTPDRVIRAAVSDGLNIDVILDYAPTWAQQPSSGFPNPSSFAAFVSAAAAHYSPIGVHTFEIWNEPNPGQEFGERWLARRHTPHC